MRESVSNEKSAVGTPGGGGEGDGRFGEVYASLLALARRHFQDQLGAHTLQPTALVHEAYVRLAQSPAGTPTDREHLLALASRAMRQILVDHARRKAALKRGGSGQRLGGEAAEAAMDEAAAAAPSHVTLAPGDSVSGPYDVLTLSRAIERLAELDPRQATIVELRFFGGLSVEQTAAALGVSERTVQLDWRMAKAWLAGELAAEEPS